MALQRVEEILRDVTNVVAFNGAGRWLLSVTRFTRCFSTLSPGPGAGVY